MQEVEKAYKMGLLRHEDLLRTRSFVWSLQAGLQVFTSNIGPPLVNVAESLNFQIVYFLSLTECTDVANDAYVSFFAENHSNLAPRPNVRKRYGVELYSILYREDGQLENILKRTVIYRTNGV